MMDANDKLLKKQTQDKIRELAKLPMIDEVFRYNVENYLTTLDTEFEKDGANAFILAMDEAWDPKCSCPACRLCSEIYENRKLLLTSWIDPHFFN